MAVILGINLTELSSAAVLKKCAEFLGDGRQHYLVTPNPEIILAAHKDEELFYILNQADLAIADGFGLKIAGRILKERVRRLTGADLTAALLEKAGREGWKVGVLNWAGGLSSAEEISRALKEKYPGLKFAVWPVGRDKFLDPERLAAVNAFAPSLLFVGLGFPYQEKLMYHNLSRLPAVKLALGVGGTFDFLSGKVRRAPSAWRRLGLEWLWRLLRQPRRFKRIYRATAVFLLKTFRLRFVNCHRYRPNVACLLYRREGGEAEIFLVERADEAGHWQLPQGGREDESPAKAGRRELSEEAGTDKFATKGVFKNVYKYNFRPAGCPTADEKTAADGSPAAAGLNRQGQKRRKYDYKGQRQSLYVAEFTGEDTDFRLNFWDHRAWKWVPAARLVESVHPWRRPGAKIFLERFKSLF